MAWRDGFFVGIDDEDATTQDIHHFGRIFPQLIFKHDTQVKRSNFDWATRPKNSQRIVSHRITPANRLISLFFMPFDSCYFANCQSTNAQKQKIQLKMLNSFSLQEKKLDANEMEVTEHLLDLVFAIWKCWANEIQTYIVCVSFAICKPNWMCACWWNAKNRYEFTMN